MGRERNLIPDKPRKGFFEEGMDKAVARNCYGVRKLTIKECTRLQGFPEDFEFPVSRTQAYKQLGNAVSVPVVTQVANQIMKVMSNKKRVKEAIVPVLSFSSGFAQ